MAINISIDINKKTDFYSPYSSGRIKTELKEYIYNECLGENYKEHIIITINTKLKLSDEEKINMVDSIRRTFGLIVQDEIFYFEKSQNKKVGLLIVGVFLIIIYYSSMVSVLREIILILGWLSIWESVYSLVFETYENSIKIRRLKELASSRVYFNIQ